MKLNFLKSIVLLSTILSGQAMSATVDWCGSTPLRWYYNSYTIYAAPVSFPDGSGMRSALQTAVDRIYANPSNFYMFLRTGSNSVGFDNGRSEVWFSTSSYYTPAICFSWSVCTYSSAYVYEVDVIFYKGISYTDSMNKKDLWGYGGNNRPFETTAVHELGHSMGLMHENREYNIMGTDYFHIHANGDTARSYLGEDGANGAVWLYGTWSNAGEDLSLAHWKWIGANGAYSAHGHTQLYSSSGSLLPSFNDTPTCPKGCEKRYNVSPGQVVQMELTAENNGRSTLTASYGYYLSTSSTITTADTLLDSDSFSMGRNNVYTYKKTLTIPSNLAPGDYWLGAIVNYDNAITETTMDNNATYTPIRVTGTTPTPTPLPQDSCEGYCGSQAPGGCYCDDVCEQYGDCCADKQQFCG